MSSPREDRSPGSWSAIDLTVEPTAREAVEYGLMEAGALGTETNDYADGQLLVSGYFKDPPNRETVRAELADALRLYELPTSSITAMELREVVDQDWLGEWKKNWQPVEVGRLIIAPPWSDIRVGGDREVIRIEPGMAFGTGTHETTRLCLKAIMRFFKGGSFLDVGTGTGILAIAAAKLHPNARISACDTDPEAVEIARENTRLNDVAGRIDFRVGSVGDSDTEGATASADFVCANLTADVISSSLPSLVSASCGRLVLSGILDSQVDSIVDQLHEAGASDTLIMMSDGEWVALIV